MVHANVTETLDPREFLVSQFLVTPTERTLISFQKVFFGKEAVKFVAVINMS